MNNCDNRDLDIDQSNHDLNIDQNICDLNLDQKVHDYYFRHNRSA